MSGLKYRSAYLLTGGNERNPNRLQYPPLASICPGFSGRRTLPSAVPGFHDFGADFLVVGLGQATGKARPCALLTLRGSRNQTYI